MNENLRQENITKLTKISAVNLLDHKLYWNHLTNILIDN